MAFSMTAVNRHYTRSTGAMPSSTTLSFSFWLRIDTDRNTYSGAFAIDNGTTDAGSGSIFMGTDVDGTTMVFGTENGTQQLTNIVNMTVGTWYWFCACKSGSTASIYYATATATTITTVNATGLSNPSGLTTLRVGSIPYTDNWVNGSMGAVKIWDGSQLSAAQAANERHLILPVVRDSLWAEYPFHQGGANAEAQTDRSGNGRTLSGGTSSTTTAANPAIKLGLGY